MSSTHSKHSVSAIHTGMGATLCLHSDRWAYTIVSVGPKHVKATRDLSTRIDDHGMSEDQHYSFAQDPSAAIEVFRLHKNGKYYNNQGQLLSIGNRRTYHDYSF